MARAKKVIENVGDVDVESDVIGEASVVDVSSLDDVSSADTQEADTADANYSDGVTNSASDTEGVASEAEAEQDAAEEEALSNISDKASENQARRERNAFLKDVAKIGASYGAGKTSMIALAERVTEEAMNKVIAVSDAEEIYKRFREAANAKATLDDAPAPVTDAATSESPATVKDDDKSLPQQLAKLRAFIKLGMVYDTEALDLMQRARNVHLRLLLGDRKSVKAGSTYTIMNSVATQHVGPKGEILRSGKVMTDDDIETFLYVDAGAKADPTAADKLLAAIVAAEAARRGSAKRGPIQSEALDEGIQKLREAMADCEGGEERLKKHDAKQAKKDEAEAVAAFRDTLRKAKANNVASEPEGEQDVMEGEVLPPLLYLPAA